MLHNENDQQGHLLRNILLFGRLLRAAGINIMPAQIIDLAEGLNHIDIRSREDFKNSARTIFVSKR